MGSIGKIVWKGATDNNPTQIAVEHEYILCYAYSKLDIPSEWKNASSETKELMLKEYQKLKITYKNDIKAIQERFRKFIKVNQDSLVPLTHYNRIDEKGVYTGSRKVHNPKPGGYKYDVIHPITKRICVPPVNGYRYPKERMNGLLEDDRILFGDNETQVIQIKEYLEDYKEKLSSVLQLDSRTSSFELSKLFPTENKIFTNPKPSSLIRKLLEFCVSKNDIVLDFFAGSCSTAQAVVDLNKEDEGSRSFIMVQIPDKLEEKKILSNELAFQTIDDIGKERIRRLFAYHDKKESNQLSLNFNESKSSGFKVFKLEKSNLKHWNDYRGDDIEVIQTSLLNFENPLIDGWKEADVVTEIQLLEGFPLDSKIEQASEFKKNRVLTVSSDFVYHKLFICLEDKLKPETIEQVNSLASGDLFICLDNALTDEAKLQLADSCNIRTI